MTFTAANLPVKGWAEYRKKLPTLAIRIPGPFAVETREGTMSCPDGWLALDANGDPYPIAADVMAASYEPASVPA
jgi:hypothetical protein